MNKSSAILLPRRSLFTRSSFSRTIRFVWLDAYTPNCFLATMNSSGRSVSTRAFSTSETVQFRYVIELPARFKYLALGGSSLAGWIASVLRPYVTRFIVCDPQRNALISHGKKNDSRDAVNLDRLCCQGNPLGYFTQIKHTERTSRMQSNSIYVFGRMMRD